MIKRRGGAPGQPPRAKAPDAPSRFKSSSLPTPRPSKSGTVQPKRNSTRRMEQHTASLLKALRMQGSDVTPLQVQLLQLFDRLNLLPYTDSSTFFREEKERAIELALDVLFLSGVFETKTGRPGIPSAIVAPTKPPQDAERFTEGALETWVRAIIAVSAYLVGSQLRLTFMGTLMADRKLRQSDPAGALAKLNPFYLLVPLLIDTPSGKEAVKLANKITMFIYDTNRRLFKRARNYHPEKVLVDALLRAFSTDSLTQEIKKHRVNLDSDSETQQMVNKWVARIIVKTGPKRPYPKIEKMVMNRAYHLKKHAKRGMRVKYNMPADLFSWLYFLERFQFLPPS
jgi:hypothetical protein